ncbi:MAG: Glutamyl-tRNA synthetase @ Glutamyl-tRNA(Gln) synthetase [uncultured Acidimicrobiales bacterium]|uniref:Glutamate--tRNA ligase n=1 Tax=uncultured Acidimicrobiales bacterium TaxID=310071 RepID=A0A6J4IRA7_9ACTN|nr:MAG: Glutamyl-tRNA synthetase @ Glutamyl-tRNA(Gln) synthetase [uncultured Acidimicrobiales bacterium]
MAAPRLRIAPSPTGLFHVGTARTALFNWLEARRTGGTFVLRIEDTDVDRNLLEAADGIQRSMEWLGLDWDEGPFFQSERRERHIEAALSLAEAGWAYWSDPMPLAPDGKPERYDGRDRDRGLERAPGRALRFRSPDEGSTRVTDLVRGEPTFPNAVLEDFGLLKGTGGPLFLLANVVDDLDMAITHVVRGEDHLSNTPKYQLLWEAIAPGTPLPLFAHLPLIVNEKRQKLSKRRDKVALEQFRDEGYLPEVMGNFLALLGWSPANGRERFRIDEVVKEFSLADVVPSSAFFDLKKLDSFNGDAIRELGADDLLERVRPFLGGWDPERARPLLSEVQTRIVRLDGVAPMVDFLYLDEPAWDDASWEKAVRQTSGATAGLLGTVADGWARCRWDVEAVREVVVEAGAAAGLNLKKAQAPVRVALTGRSVGPPLFESTVILGRAEAVRRVRAALERVPPPPA